MELLRHLWYLTSLMPDDDDDDDDNDDDNKEGNDDDDDDNDDDNKDGDDHLLGHPCSKVVSVLCSLSRRFQFICCSFHGQLWAPISY